MKKLDTVGFIYRERERARERGRQIERENAKIENNAKKPLPKTSCINAKDDFFGLEGPSFLTCSTPVSSLSIAES